MYSNLNTPRVQIVLTHSLLSLLLRLLNVYVVLEYFLTGDDKRTVEMSLGEFRDHLLLTHKCFQLTNLEYGLLVRIRTQTALLYLSRTSALMLGLLSYSLHMQCNMQLQLPHINSIIDIEVLESGLGLDSRPDTRYGYEMWYEYFQNLMEVLFSAPPLHRISLR